MAPKKKVTGLIKLQINAGAATPAPPIGPALGQHGVNIMEFVKAYNAQTESQRGNVIPVEITIYEDRTFTFITKTPPASVLIKKAIGIDGHHANVAGEYLGACVFYEFLYGDSVVGNPFVPKGLDANFARFLQETAFLLDQQHASRRRDDGEERNCPHHRPRRCGYRAAKRWRFRGDERSADNLISP